jgi:predicted dienelactone hydrolase
VDSAGIPQSKQAADRDRKFLNVRSWALFGHRATKLPLVIVSHGRGGWFGLHHNVEEALADAGFVVAAINHPGDTTNERRSNPFYLDAERWIASLRSQ